MLGIDLFILLWAGWFWGPSATLVLRGRLCTHPDAGVAAIPQQLFVGNNLQCILHRKALQGGQPYSGMKASALTIHTKACFCYVLLLRQVLHTCNEGCCCQALWWQAAVLS